MITQTSERFCYETRDNATRFAARTVLELVWKKFGDFDAVLDVGCGVGTWLSVSAEMGASKIMGIEAPWINDVRDLSICREAIRIVDLEGDWILENSTFNLGICLEVAEHLSESAGQRLVQRLCSSCDVIVFSAAIPEQGGNGHINEQWPSYWQEQFASLGKFGIDAIRPAIWDNLTIPWWYRQNTVVYASEPILQRYFEKLANEWQENIGPLPSFRMPPGTISHYWTLRSRIKRAISRLSPSSR